MEPYLECIYRVSVYLNKEIVKERTAAAPIAAGISTMDSGHYGGNEEEHREHTVIDEFLWEWRIYI